MIYEARNGTFTISSRRVWLPGVYESRRAARYAFRLPDQTLQRLQDEANAWAGGTGGVITFERLLPLATPSSRPYTHTVVRCREPHGGSPIKKKLCSPVDFSGRRSRKAP